MTFAWRCWGLMARAPGILASALDPNLRRFEWAPGPCWQRPAWCGFPDGYVPHAAPDAGACSRCGWHALPDLADLIWWLADFKGLVPHVIGGVELGGTILRGSPVHPETPDLRRGELAAVVGPLVVAPGLSTSGHVQALADRYRVEVRLSSSCYPWPRSWVRSAAADLAQMRPRQAPPDASGAGDGEPAWGPPGGRGLVRFR